MEQFDTVVVTQPSHVADKEAVIVAAQAFVNILAEPGDATEIYVNIYGSLGWKNSETPSEFISAAVTINAQLRSK